MKKPEPELTKGNESAPFLEFQHGRGRRCRFEKCEILNVMEYITDASIPRAECPEDSFANPP